jgi:hypothetical protein
MAVRVYEAGADDLFVGVKDPSGLDSSQVADGHDALSLDAHIRPVPRIARSIHNAPVGQEKVEQSLLPSRHQLSPNVCNVSM